jgi:hypothetical protein
MLPIRRLLMPNYYLDTFGKLAKHDGTGLACFSQPRTCANRSRYPDYAAAGFFVH